MKIQDALKETEIVTPDYVNSKKESHAKLFDGILYWYEDKIGELFIAIRKDNNNYTLSDHTLLIKIKDCEII